MDEDFGHISSTGIVDLPGKLNPYMHENLKYAGGLGLSSYFNRVLHGCKRDTLTLLVFKGFAYWHRLLIIVFVSVK